MKWITHQAGAVLGAAALGLSAPAVGAAFCGAVIPDLIDQKFSRCLGAGSRQKIFNRIHRGSSHWFGWWAALFLLALSWPLPFRLNEIAIGLAFGGLSHVLLDFFTPRGVPFLPFTRKFSLAAPICSTGKSGEYLFLGCMLLGGLVYWRQTLLTIWERAGQYFQI